MVSVKLNQAPKNNQPNTICTLIGQAPLCTVPVRLSGRLRQVRPIVIPYEQFVSLDFSINLVTGGSLDSHSDLDDQKAKTLSVCLNSGASANCALQDRPS